MNPEIQAIAHLAEIDAARDRARKEIRDLQSALERAGVARDEAQAAVQAAQSALADVVEAERAAQRRITEMTQRQKSALYVLEHGGAGVDAAEKQLKQSKADADAAETDVLVAMEAQDAARKRIADAERAEHAAEAARQAAATEVPPKIAAVEARLAGLDTDRSQAAAALLRETLTRYESVRAKRGSAVAGVKDGTCVACQRVVAAQHLSDLRRGASVEPCRGCGRWLVL